MYDTVDRDQSGMLDREVNILFNDCSKSNVLTQQQHVVLSATESAGCALVENLRAQEILKWHWNEDDEAREFLKACDANNVRAHRHC